MRAHAHAHHRNFRDRLIALHGRVADFVLEIGDHLPRARQIRCIGGKRNIRRRRGRAVADVLHNHIHIHRRLRQRREHPRRVARFIRHRRHGHLCLIAIQRHAAHDDRFHTVCFFHHDCSRIVVKTRAHFKFYIKLFGEFHRPALHHLRAEAGQLHHFVIRNFIQLSRIGHHARIGRVHAIHVRINLAQVRFQNRSQRNRRQVRSSPPQRGNAPVTRLPLKPRHDHHVAFVQHRMNLPGRDVVNLRLRVNSIGHNARLCTGQRNRRQIQRMQRHRQ